MKIDPRISAELARLEPNQVGVLAWSLLAHPPIMAGASRVSPIPIPPTNNLRNRESPPCRMSRHPRLLSDHRGHISLSPMTNILHLSSCCT